MRLFLRRTKSSKFIFAAIFAALILCGGIIAVLNIKNHTHALATVDSNTWELSTFFTVDQDQEHLTSYEWNVGSDTTGIIRKNFVFQINYKTKQSITEDYEPGDLQIVVDIPFATPNGTTNLYYATAVDDEVGGENFIDSLNIYNSDYSARKKGSSSSVERDWEYECKDSEDASKPKTCTFTNIKPFTAGTSIDGAIQLVYAIDSEKIDAVLYKDSITTKLNYSGKAILNNTVNSNEISLDYSRTQDIDWKHREYDVHVTPYKVDSYDGLGSDAGDYIWVHYYYYGQAFIEGVGSYGESYPGSASHNRDFSRIPVEGDSWYWEDALSENVKVLDSDKQVMNRNSSGKFVVSKSIAKKDARCTWHSYSWDITASCSEVYVGYPKTQYAGQTVTNEVTSKGIYHFESEESILDTDNATVNLDEFALEYHGNDVGITKKALDKKFSIGDAYSINSSSIKSDAGGSVYFSIDSQALNMENGNFDLVIGDDLAYYEDVTSGEINQLNEEDYSFKRIAYPNKILFANYGESVCDNYRAKVYYRLRGHDLNDYEELPLDEETNKACTGNDYARSKGYWDFDENSLGGQVVGWRVELRNLDKSVKNYTLETELNLKSDSLPDNGKVYNFSYVEVWQNNQIVNTTSINNYGEGISRNYVANYDQSTYGHYQQRAFDSYEWEPYILGEIYQFSYAGISSSKNSEFDSSADSFVGELEGDIGSQDHSSDGETDWSVAYPSMKESDFIDHLTAVMLLPKGFDVDSTEEEIIDSISYRLSTHEIRYGVDGKKWFENNSEAEEYLKSHTTVKIVRDWGDDARDKIIVQVDLSDKPFSVLNQIAWNYLTSVIRYKVKYRAPYEVYAEDPNKIHYALNYGFNDSTCKNWPGSVGRYYCAAADSDDKDEDGVYDEYISGNSVAIKLIAAQAGEQYMKELVNTDQTEDYTTNDSYATAGKDYSYKLGVHTGMNRATNIVIYDNLEMAYGDNGHWKGAFDGVDTTFADSRTDYNGNTIKIKVWYSENENAGSLSSGGWNEYVEGTTDKSKVKSIAFEYSTNEGVPAELGINNYIYTLVKMKAPTVDSADYAYNAFRSEWNAIDSTSGEVLDGVVGVDSNVTRVLLDHPVTVRVVKQWDDFDNTFSTRPATVNPKLMNGSELMDDSKTINTSQDGASVQFENLHEYYKDDYDIALSLGDDSPYTTELISKEVDGNTITFTFKSSLEKDKITVRKIWIDNDNNLRPDSVDFDLKRGSSSVEEKTLGVKTNDNEYEFDFSEFPAYLFDEFSVPMIDEIPNYHTELEISDDRHTYTFTSTLTAPMDIHVKQVWVDKNNAYGYRPGSFDYTLNKADGTSESKTLNFSTDGTINEFSDTFSGLPLLDKPQYTIDSMPDITIPNYSTVKTFDADTMTYIYTSTLDVPLDIKVVQVWEDEDNLYGLRPEETSYKLTQSNSEIDGKSFDIANGQSEDTFTGLSMLSKDDYDMPLDLATISDDYSTVVEVDKGETTMIFTFISKLVAEPVTVVHIWDDEDNILGIRPDEISFDLAHRTETECEEPETEGDETDDSDGTTGSNEGANDGDDESEEPVEPQTCYNDETIKTHTMNVLEEEDTHVFDKVPSSIIDEFVVNMAEVDYYETAVDYDEDSHTFTFTSKLRGTEVHVVNIWEDSDNALGKRPESLTFFLMNDNEQEQEYTIDTKEKTESFDYEHLFAYLKDHYQVVLEKNPEGYETTVDFDPETMTFTFVHVVIEPVDTVDKVSVKTFSLVGAGVAAFVAMVFVGIKRRRCLR